MSTVLDFPRGTRDLDAADTARLAAAYRLDLAVAACVAGDRDKALRLLMAAQGCIATGGLTWAAALRVPQVPA